VSPSTTSPSTKYTTSHNVRCDVCGLWYSALHPARDGRDLCRMCLELEGQNRSEFRSTRSKRRLSNMDSDGRLIEHGVHPGGRILAVE
jgi:hypothetical protein